MEALFATSRCQWEIAGDTAGIGEERLRGFVSAVAIPLSDGDKPFAVLQLFTGKQIDQSSEIVKVLQAVRDHVTPIFRSSLAFERSLTNALTDAVTGLPNERAFRMVLENHLAESARHREARPLSVLTIDIRDFAAVNTMLGHAAGDRLLEFAARRIGESLRRMDFLARTVNDEFNIILPTATEKVALEIIDRIKRGFESAEFDIGGGESFSVALNIGWASFWKDGETGDQLLRAAHQRRRQAKSETPQGVLWFPKEYVH
jgi:diguanylate cyclase (GGDEF)-like protein